MLLAQQEHVPTYVDLEYASLKDHADLRSAANALRAKGTRLICSAHDFTRRPPDLLRIVSDMGADDDCDVIKVAFHASAPNTGLNSAVIRDGNVDGDASLFVAEFELKADIDASAPTAVSMMKVMGADAKANKLGAIYRDSVVVLSAP